MATAAASLATPPTRLGEARPEARAAIRDLLTSAAAYHTLDPETRRTIAASLVRISSTALALAEEGGSDEQERNEAKPPTSAFAAELPLAQAQNAGSEFSGVSASRVADTTKQILNAVSFPRFVNELITGVFKALHESNQQQMSSFVELVKNVSTTIEGFADANVGDTGARNWLAERFPGSFVVSGDTDDSGFDDPARMTPEERKEWQAERDASTKLKLKPNAAMPSEAALKTALGLGPQDSVPSSGDPENLVGFARSALAKQRQQILSSMVMMGLQRLVVDSGRLNASMRFHIDTRSAAANDTGSMFDVRNESEATGKLGVGPWGMEAKVKNTIGYVSTETTQTTEEMNTSVDLNSSVELIFHTDYVPLSRLAGVGDIDRIRVNSLNPAEELRIGGEEAKARIAAQRHPEAGRESALSQRLQRPAPPPAPPAPVAPKQDAKDPAKDGAKQPAPDGAQEPSKDAAKEPAKDTSKQPVKTTETPVKAPAKIAPKR